MSRDSNLRKKSLLGYGAIFILCLVVLAMTIWQVAQTEKIADRLIQLNLPASAAGMDLLNGIHRSMSALRGYVLLGDEQLRKERTIAWNDHIDPACTRLDVLSRNWDNTINIDRLRTILSEVDELRELQDRVEAVSRLTDEQRLLDSKVAQIRRNLNRMLQSQKALMEDQESNALQGAKTLEISRWVMVGGCFVLCLLCGVFIALFCRNLFAEIQRLQSALGESADQSCHLGKRAIQAASRCKEGHRAVLEAQEATTEIRNQIQKVVRHALDLGTRSREVTRIADIIRELSEETAVLGYNTAIEAAGAGKDGQPFAVIADQVARISERAKSALDEVRVMLEEFQQATNTAIMATEESLKAADRGVQVQNEASGKIESLAQEIHAAQETASGGVG